MASLARAAARLRRTAFSLRSSPLVATSEGTNGAVPACAAGAAPARAAGVKGGTVASSTREVPEPPRSVVESFTAPSDAPLAYTSTLEAPTPPAASVLSALRTPPRMRVLPKWAGPLDEPTPTPTPPAQAPLEEGLRRFLPAPEGPGNRCRGGPWRGRWGKPARWPGTRRSCDHCSHRRSSGVASPRECEPGT